MRVVFRSKRECYAICIGITLMVWAALTVALFMLLSLRHGGLLLVHFNLYNELWIELPLAVGIAIFSLWFMWTVAKKSHIGYIPYLTKEPIKPGRIFGPGWSNDDWDCEEDEVWNDV